MPLLVQHVSTSDDSRLRSQGVAFPADSSSPGTRAASTAQLSILAPSKGRDPYRVALRHAALSIAARATEAVLTDVAVEANVAVADGQCVAACVVTPSAESEGTAVAALNAVPARHLFLFGGQRRANEHSDFGCSA